MSLSNTSFRKPYYLFLFGGIGACAFLYLVFPLTFISFLLTLMGFIFPASFLSPEIKETTQHRRYRFSSLRILVGINNFFLEQRFISRWIAPHCFSFLACLSLRVFVSEGSLIFWLIGAMFYELSGLMMARQNEAFAAVFRAQRDGREIHSS